MISAFAGPEPREIAQDIERQHRHREISPPEVRKGIEAGRDIAMALALAAQQQSAPLPRHDGRHPRMHSEELALSELQHPEIDRVGELVGAAPSGDLNVRGGRYGEVENRISWRRHYQQRIDARNFLRRRE